MDRIPADGGYGWENADGKVRKDAKKVKRIKREIRMAKINKSHGWALHVTWALSIVGTGYSGFFLNSLNPVLPFINATETRTHRSYSLKLRVLWCTSPLSRKPGYSVLNLRKRKCFPCNQIENFWFERVGTKNYSLKKQKGGT